MDRWSATSVAVASDWAAVLSLDYHIEQTDDGFHINVEQADALLVMCMDCAPGRSAITDALRAAGLPAPDTPHGADSTRL
jgi:hypothetical protein